MRHTQRSIRKGRSPLREFMDQFADWEPDPLTVELYRLDPLGQRHFLAILASHERSLGDIQRSFGGGEYQIVVRYRGRVRVTPVFVIWGLPIDDKT